MFIYVYRPLGEKYPLCKNGTAIEGATEYEGLCVFNNVSAVDMEVPELAPVDDSQALTAVTKSMDDGNYTSSKKQHD